MNFSFKSIATLICTFAILYSAIVNAYVTGQKIDKEKDKNTYNFNIASTVLLFVSFLYLGYITYSFFTEQ
jgi:uncharacterized membrane protein